MEDVLKRQEYKGALEQGGEREEYVSDILLVDEFLTTIVLPIL